MPIDKNINLDLPVEAYDAEGNPKEKPEVISEEKSPEVSQTEDKKEEVIEKKEEEDEQRVPYSRFSKVRERAEQAEQEAEESRELLRQMMRNRPAETEEKDPYEEVRNNIFALYGDTPASRQVADVQIKQLQLAEERSAQRVLESIENQRSFETKAISQNEKVIEDRIERLSDRLGRELTENEEISLLEIVDEYTPTGEDGKYAGEILPLDKAWEVYELRQSQKSQASKRSRSTATAASGSRSEGEPSGDVAERDKNFNPRNWNSLNDRISKL